MDFDFKKYTNHNGDFIEITGFKAGCDTIEIPESIDGLLIDAISQRALSWSNNITLFILHSQDGDYSMAKYILNNTSQALRIRFIMPGGNLELAFPGFNDKVVEDTMARAIHLKIEGSGYAYRECVLRERIDTKGYDEIFARAKAESGIICADIALSRLMFPLELSENAQAAYREYCKENAGSIAKHLIETKDKHRLSFLFSEFEISDSIVREALMLTTAKKFPGLTTVIMQNSRKNEKENGKG